MALSFRGRDGEAEPLLEQVIRPAHRPTGARARLLALGCLAAIAARRGDGDTAASHAGQAADLGASHRLAGHWAIITADLTVAGLLADRGDLAAAEAAAVAALGHAQQHRARLETATALLTLAAICTRAGRAADARDRISQAAALIAQCPDPGILAGQLAAAQYQVGPPVPAAQPPGRGRARGRRPDGLTAREAEVLQLLTNGSTNLEIAAALVVSVHTVERHLQNSYRKIGFRNRADAAAYMARHER